MKQKFRDAATSVLACAVLLYLSPLIICVGVYLGYKTSKDETVSGN